MDKYFTKNKTTLADGDIYQKKDERAESKGFKGNFKELTFGEKLKYFKDYVLLKLLIVIVVISAIVGFAIYQSGRKSVEKLHITIESPAMFQSDWLDSCSDRLGEYIGLKDDETVFVDWVVGDDTVQTMMMAGDADIEVGLAQKLSKRSSTYYVLDELLSPETLALIPEEAGYVYSNDSEKKVRGILVEYTVFSEGIEKLASDKNRSQLVISFDGSSIAAREDKETIEKFVRFLFEK